MIHWLRLVVIIYLGGLGLTAALMDLCSVLSGECMESSLARRKFFGFWLLLWPVSLPVVLYLLATRRGPETGGRP